MEGLETHCEVSDCDGKGEGTSGKLAALPHSPVLLKASQGAPPLENRHKPDS